jgi:hypothetical protein
VNSTSFSEILKTSIRNKLAAAAAAVAVWSRGGKGLLVAMREVMDETSPTLDEKSPTMDEKSSTMDETNPTMDETSPTLDEKSSTMDKQRPTMDEKSPTLNEMSAIQAHPMRGENTGNGNAKPAQSGIWRSPWALWLCRSPWALWLYVAQPAPNDSAASSDPPASIQRKQPPLLFEPARTKGMAKDNFVVEHVRLRRPGLRSMIFII